jgi:hypothetical protein
LQPRHRASRLYAVQQSDHLARRAAAFFDEFSALQVID